MTRPQHLPIPDAPTPETPEGSTRSQSELRLPSVRTLLRLGVQAAAIGLVASTILVAMTVEPDTWRRVAGWRWQAAPILIGLMVVSWTVNGLRIMRIARALHHPLNLVQSLSISLPAMFGTAATPSSIGAPILRLGLSRRAGIPLSEAAAMTAVNYTVDMVYFAALAPFAVMVVLEDPTWRHALSRIEPPDMRTLAAIGLVALLVVVAATWYRSRSDRRLLAGLRDRLRVDERAGRMGAALKNLALRHPGTLLVDLVLASLQWTARYATLPVILVPGGGGGVEALSAFVLTGLVPDGTVGVVVLIWRAVTYHFGLVVSGTVLVLVLGHLDRLFGVPSENALPEETSSPLTATGRDGKPEVGPD